MTVDTAGSSRVRTPKPTMGTPRTHRGALGMKGRVTAACLVAGVVAGAAIVPVPSPLSGTVGIPAADADEKADVLAELAKLSHEAEEKTEEYKNLEDTIAATDAELEKLTAAAADTKKAALSARTGVVTAKSAVDRVAQAHYREINTDPITEVLTADGPQRAIDKAAYLSALSNRSKKVVSHLGDAVTDAARAADDAARAKARTEFVANQLKQHREELQQQQAELTKRTEELKKRVDELDAQEKAQWEAKNSPDTTVTAATINLPDGGSNTGAIAAAMNKLGAPYSWGAAGPDAFDCSGLMVWSFLQIGKHIPRTSQAQMHGGTPVDLADIQPGDIVGYYRNASHVGLYIGGGKIVHSSDYGIPVQVVSLRSAPIYGIRRY